MASRQNVFSVVHWISN